MNYVGRWASGENSRMFVKVQDRTNAQASVSTPRSSKNALYTKNLCFPHKFLNSLLRIWRDSGTVEFGRETTSFGKLVAFETLNKK
jgi:hypothetical protein